MARNYLNQIKRNRKGHINKMVDGRTYLETESLLEAPEDDYKVTWQRGT